MYAGLAFSNTQTAIAHSISYFVTMYKNVPHGIACSFTLPMLVDKAINKYDFIDQALLDIFGSLSSDKIRQLMNQLNIPINFSDYGINDNELMQIKASLEGTSRMANSLLDF